MKLDSYRAVDLTCQVWLILQGGTRVSAPTVRNRLIPLQLSRISLTKSRISQNLLKPY